MTYTMLAEQAQGLTEESILEVAKYIEFLKFKQASYGNRPAKRRLDRLAGGMVYMSEDFDESLEDFKEYM